jgi:hypothetical protein
MRRAGTGLLFIGVLMSGCAGHPANPLSFLLTPWSFMPNRDKPLRRLWIAFRPPEEWWFWELELDQRISLGGFHVETAHHDSRIGHAGLTPTSQQWLVGPSCWAL